MAELNSKAEKHRKRQTVRETASGREIETASGREGERERGEQDEDEETTETGREKKLESLMAQPL